MIQLLFFNINYFEKVSFNCDLLSKTCESRHPWLLMSLNHVISSKSCNLHVIGFCEIVISDFIVL